MTEIRRSRDIEPAVDEMYDLLHTPITTASKFYTYYWLTEVRGFNEVEFKLNNLSRKLADAFYNYGLYACLREYTNYGEHFFMRNVHARAWTRYSRQVNTSSEDISRLQRVQERENFDSVSDMVDVIFSRIDSTIETRMDYPDAKPAAKVMMEDWRLRFSGVGDQRKIEDIIEKADKMFGLAGETDKILKALEFVFGHEWQAERFLKYDDGWSPEYGGESWARVAETTREQYADLSHVPFVDLMWSVEHNNGNFLDKISWDRSLEKERILNSILRQKYSVEERGTTTIGPGLKNILKDVLQKAREEDMKPLWDIARQDDTSLRRYRGEFM